MRGASRRSAVLAAALDAAGGPAALARVLGCSRQLIHAWRAGTWAPGEAYIPALCRLAGSDPEEALAEARLARRAAARRRERGDA